jgi:hypothetical protein
MHGTLRIRLPRFGIRLPCPCCVVLRQFPAILAAPVAQNIYPTVIGANLEIVVVFAIPSVEDLHNLASFTSHVKPQGPLPGAIPVIAFNADLQGLNPGTRVFSICDDRISLRKNVKPAAERQGNASHMKKGLSCGEARREYGDGGG